MPVPGSDDRMAMPLLMRSLICPLLMIVSAILLAAVPAACDRGWNARERETVRQTLAQIQADAETAGAARPPEPPTLEAVEEEGTVRLDLVDAIRLALANNQDIQISGYEALRAEADLVAAQAVYDPAVVASNTFGRSKRPTASTLDTGVITDTHLTEDTWEFSGGLRQRLATGGTFTLTQQMDYLDTNSRLIIPNPQYSSGLTFEASQPLLKNFGDPEAQSAIRIATVSTGVSLHDFRQKTAEIVARVVAAYWQLVFDRQSVEVFRESADQAREILRRETARAERGISNNLNIARAESTLASREVQVVRGENRARDSADALKRLLSAPQIPVQGRAEILPTRTPRFFQVDVDRQEAMAQALARRPELARARGVIDASRIRVDVADRQRLPRLDALLRYTLNGLGNDLGGALDMQDFRDPVTWVAGLELEWPLGNRAARAELLRRRAEYEQTLLEADRLADQVMEEVSVAARAVERGRGEVESTLRAQTAAQTVLEGEQTRLELQPMDRRSNEDLLRALDQLTQARRDHLVALLNFNLALAELARARGTLLEDEGIEVIWPEADRTDPLVPVEARLPAEPAPPK